MTVHFKYSFYFFCALLFSWNCSSNNLNLHQLDRDQSVKLFYKDGTVDNGVILKKDIENIHYVSEATHQEKISKLDDILRVERLKIVYDYKAYEISNAEIDKNKGTGNTWGYALGGAVIGAAAGIAVGLPLWYADIDQVPPYFLAGAGAVAASIYFAFKGQDKDKELAVKKIRYSRMSNEELKRLLEEEKKQIEELEKQKQKLQNQIKTTK
jgi:hypothetical protein